ICTCGSCSMCGFFRLERGLRNQRTPSASANCTAIGHTVSGGCCRSVPKRHTRVVFATCRICSAACAPERLSLWVSCVDCIAPRPLRRAPVHPAPDLGGAQLLAAPIPILAPDEWSFPVNAALSQPAHEPGRAACRHHDYPDRAGGDVQR